MVFLPANFMSVSTFVGLLFHCSYMVYPERVQHECHRDQPNWWRDHHSLCRSGNQPDNLCCVDRHCAPGREQFLPTRKSYVAAGRLAGVLSLGRVGLDVYAQVG